MHDEAIRLYDNRRSASASEVAENLIKRMTSPRRTFRVATNGWSEGKDDKNARKALEEVRDVALELAELAAASAQAANMLLAEKKSIPTLCANHILEGCNIHVQRQAKLIKGIYEAFKREGDALILNE